MRQKQKIQRKQGEMPKPRSFPHTQTIYIKIYWAVKMWWHVQTTHFKIRLKLRKTM